MLERAHRPGLTGPVASNITAAAALTATFASYHLQMPSVATHNAELGGGLVGATVVVAGRATPATPVNLYQAPCVVLHCESSSMIWVIFVAMSEVESTLHTVCWILRCSDDFCLMNRFSGAGVRWSNVTSEVIIYGTYCSATFLQVLCRHYYNYFSVV